MKKNMGLRPTCAAVRAVFERTADHTPFAAAALVSLAMAPGLAAAQTGETMTTLPRVEVQGQAIGGDYAAGETTVGAKTPTPVRDIPQVVNVVPRAVIDAQQANTLTDALRYVPGITLSAGEGGAIGDNINLRGQSARTDVFIDGFRDRGQYTRDTFFLESVEVLKGPSSLFFGRGSTGGVVNQVSKAPSLRNHNDVGLTIGTEDYYRASVDINRAISETAAFRVAAFGHTSDSTRDVVESERYGIAPSLRFGIGTPTTVTLSSVHLRSEEIPDLGIPTIQGTKANPGGPVHVDHDNFYGYTDDYFDQDVDAVTARIEHKFSPSLTLRNQTQYSSARIDTRATNIHLDTALNVWERGLRTREIDDTSLYNQTDLIAKFDTGGIKHTVVVGVEVGRDEYERTSFGPNDGTVQDLQNPVYGPLPSHIVQLPSSVTETDATTLAVYANDQVELNRHWKIVGGLRWDRFDVDQKAREVSTGDVTKLEQTDEVLSGRIGVVYQPTLTQSYYVSYGNSFNPSAETISLSEANENVDPEENKSYEIGGKWDLLNGNVSLTAAIFRIEKSDARSLDPVTGEVLLSGETQTDGFELGATGRILPNWQVFGGYTYLDGEIERLDERDGRTGPIVSRDGNDLVNTPKHNFTLWTTYFLTPEWELGGGLVYSSKRTLNNANTAEVGSYTRYDLTLAYHQKDYDIRLNVLNLTDKEYFEVASSSRAVPAQGRTALVTATYRF